MKKCDRAMMDLIASEVCGKTIDRAQYTFSDEELISLYKLSKSHDLAHLVGDALIKNDLIANDEIKQKFEKQVMTAVYRYERINYELGRLKETLNEAKIPFIPLKGSVIRQYYPEPWMRTSCDIDILVHEGDLERAAELITEKLSYREDSQGPHDIGFFSDSGVHLELHFSLIEDKFVGDVDVVLQSVWDESSATEGLSEHILSDAMFYYYHIAHMAKHFTIGGCGIRPFLDIWVLNHKVPHDKDERDTLLKAGGILTFALEAEKLSEVWFENIEYTDTARQMERYVLCGGVYGTMTNKISVQQVKRGGKIRYAISRIWLPYDTLIFNYPSLEGKRILLPFYEVRRWCKLLFCGGAKRGMNELKINSATTRDGQAEIKEMLLKLELDH
ncbi:MAG: nucleotidyltransferase family protein [Eubacteriales bacterium]